jgi:hypothetical protein
VTADRALLGELAAARLVGSPRHLETRDLLRRELAQRGFVVLEHRFAAAPRFPLWGPAPSEGVNLIAVRPHTRITTWLAAHYDSKGQPLSMAWRLLAVIALVTVLVGAIAATVFGGPRIALWIGALALAAGFLALNRATDASPGAVDNATGLLTVLAALDATPPEAGVGALLLDAEEWGLVGARALVRDRANLLAGTAVINFDGIDDRGAPVLFAHRRGALTEALAARLGARPRRRLPVVVDGLVLARAARECVTIMRGDWGTTRVIHTPRDTATRLTLDGVRAVAQATASVLASAARAG